MCKSNSRPLTILAGMQAAYIRVPRIARRRVHEAGLPFRDGLHAASHAMLNVIPLYMLCGSTDMGAECDNPYDTRYRPERLLVYDKHPGGIGLAAQVPFLCITVFPPVGGLPSISPAPSRRLFV